MTEKLYYKEPYKKEFNADILESVKENNVWKVILNRTCFYPEGGGQPADKGWINDVPVVDVRKKDDVIYHYCSKDPGEEKANGKVDWLWRSDFMQQHTGQHIISAAFLNVGKYDTVSVHFGEKHSTIEIDAPNIPDKDIEKVENIANQAINRNLRVHFIWTNSDEIDKFPLRRPCTHDGKLRIIQIGDYDCVACSGMHFESTGAVGLVKVIGVEKIRGHVRTIWKIGRRAYKDYHQKDTITSSLKSLLSASEDNIVHKTIQLKESISALEKKCDTLEEKIAKDLADDIYNEEMKKSKQGKPGISVIVKSWNQEDNGALKKVMLNLTARAKILVCFVNVYNDKLLYWSIGCSEEIDFPFNEMRKDLLQIIKGKGGGYHPLWQGIGLDSKQHEEFIRQFKNYALEFILK